MTNTNTTIHTFDGETMTTKFVLDQYDINDINMDDIPQPPNRMEANFPHDVENGSLRSPEEILNAARIADMLGYTLDSALSPREIEVLQAIYYFYAP